MEKVTEDAGQGGLVWAAYGGSPCNDDEGVKENTKHGDAKDDRRNGCVNSPKVK